MLLQEAIKCYASGWGNIATQQAAIHFRVLWLFTVQWLLINVCWWCFEWEANHSGFRHSVPKTPHRETDTIIQCDYSSTSQKQVITALKGCTGRCVVLQKWGNTLHSLFSEWKLWTRKKERKKEKTFFCVTSNIIKKK